MSQASQTIFIQSKSDYRKFTINKAVIDSSTLLKNICDFTEVSEIIWLDCSGGSLEVFIKIINNFHKNNGKHDKEFEANLFNSVTSRDKKQLIKLVQDLCILDSDIFLDSISDYILGIFGNKKREMNSTEIQEYLGLESDFSGEEKNLIMQHQKLEYFLSIDIKNFKFPFPNKSLYSLKTDFSTPMNILLARIIQLIFQHQ